MISGDTPFAGAGLFYIPLEHHGNQNRSQEEVEVVVGIVRSLVAGEVRKTNSEGEVSLLTESDILIVAPYNAQVSAISEKLPRCRTGTVDKFQGQEAAVVIYSMTSSSATTRATLFTPRASSSARSRAAALSTVPRSDTTRR